MANNCCWPLLPVVPNRALIPLCRLIGEEKSKFIKKWQCGSEVQRVGRRSWMLPFWKVKISAMHLKCKEFVRIAEKGKIQTEFLQRSHCWDLICLMFCLLLTSTYWRKLGCCCSFCLIKPIFFVEFRCRDQHVFHVHQIFPYTDRWINLCRCMHFTPTNEASS